jgi:hypothetical protein
VAEEQAVLGDHRRARAALAQAEAALPSCLPGDNPTGLFVIWDETRLPGWVGKALLILGDRAATGLLEQALPMTRTPHPRLGLLVDLALARIRDGNADEAVTLLLEGIELAVERGIEGFARGRLQEGRVRLPAAQRRVLDGRLHALA